VTCGTCRRTVQMNPIEKLWSKVKAWLRRVGAGTFDAVVHAIGDALRAVASDECFNYFLSCGYHVPYSSACFLP